MFIERKRIRSSEGEEYSIARKRGSENCSINVSSLGDFKNIYFDVRSLPADRKEGLMRSRIWEPSLTVGLMRRFADCIYVSTELLQ